MINQEIPKEVKNKNLKGFANDEQLLAWKKARNGLFIFMGLHLIYEVVIQNPNAIIMLAINYFISTWIIKTNIRGGDTISNPLIYGIKVAGVIFVCRLLLGIAIMFFLKV